MPETASTTLAFVELLDQLKVRLHHRHQHQLSNALADGDVEGRLTTVPSRHHQLALVIGVDQTHQIT